MILHICIIIIIIIIIILFFKYFYSAVLFNSSCALWVSSLLSQQLDFLLLLPLPSIIGIIPIIMIGQINGAITDNILLEPGLNLDINGNAAKISIGKMQQRII
jgi:hypothetical protein